MCLSYCPYKHVTSSKRKPTRVLFIATLQRRVFSYSSEDYTHLHPVFVRRGESLLDWPLIARHLQPYFSSHPDPRISPNFPLAPVALSVPLFHPPPPLRNACVMQPPTTPIENYEKKTFINYCHSSIIPSRAGCNNLPRRF